MKPCPKCGVKPGELHSDECCYPKHASCRELGWYCYYDSRLNRHRCGADHPNAVEDMARFHKEAVWDPDRSRFIPRDQFIPQNEEDVWD